jgi:hypothetical protein
MNPAGNPRSPVADPFLEEVRARKESVSSAFGHDVVKLCEALRKEQAASGRRVIRRTTSRPTGTASR